VVKEDIPSYLNIPVRSTVNPPVDTKEQRLPFLELAWEDFERLCYRLVREENNVEFCRPYGTKGQKQDGIDIYARNLSQEKYMVFQCKRYKKLTASIIDNAVIDFLDGEWSEKSSAFVFCTNQDLTDANLSNEFEKQVSILKQKKIKFLPWDQKELNTKLKNYHNIVYDFFGLPWVERFCGNEIAKEISYRKKLSPTQVIEFRRELKDFYSIVFSKYDIGLPSLDVSKAGLNLRDRFIIPDIIKERTVKEVVQEREETKRAYQSTYDREQADDIFTAKRQRTVTRTIETRVDVQQVLADNDRHIILGEPGVGKSTLLRFISLDLLSDNPKLSRLSAKWGSFLPVWVPFAFLTKKIESQDISLSDLVHLWFKVMDHESLFELVKMALEDERLLLLVDGIDEWKDANSAQIAINRLSSFIESKGTHSVITGRPYGYKQLRVSIEKVEIHTLSGFSEKQQKEFIVNWATHWEKSQNKHLTQETTEKSACKTAGDLLEELRSVPKLTELAQYPLMLSILLSFKLRHLSLPHDRFEAYNKIIEGFIEKHPNERLISAEITESFSPMCPEERISIFEFLAYYAQTASTEGLITIKKAKKLIEDYLEKEIGYSRLESSQQAREIIEFAKNFIGVLVERSSEELGFFHRLLQEYLAAKYISRLPFEKQIECIKANAVNPQWSEVIQGIIHEIRRKDEVIEIIEVLEKLIISANLGDRYRLNLLIYQIVFDTGYKSCDLQLSRRIFEKAVHDIEFNSWMPYREKVLDIFIDGLHNSKLRPQIIKRIELWFPNRFRYGYDYIITQTELWEETPELITCLWNNIFNSEDIKTQKAAAKALAKRKSGDAGWGDKFAEKCMKYPDLEIRAIIFEGILTGWPNHSVILKFISVNRKSPCHLLRFMAIKGKIASSIHNDNDLDEMIFLSSQLSNLGYDWRDDIVQTILRGWNSNKKIKEECLNGVDKLRNKETIYMGEEIAWEILFQGYVGDKDVEQRIVEEIAHAEYPFSMAHQSAWILLGEYWYENRMVSKAVEGWILNFAYHEPEIYAASFAARSNPVKQKLLSMLDKSILHWQTKALLDIWGMQDKEVNEKLTGIISSELRRCNEIAHLLPDIIPDKEECKNRLLEILRSTDLRRHDNLISGLAKLSGEFEFTDAIDYLLDKILPTLKSDFWGLVYSLIYYFPDNKRVKSIAKNELNSSNWNFRAVVMAYHDDPDFNSKIIQTITPLPKKLRSILIKRLGEFSRLSNISLPILKYYYLEEEASTHTEASIAYHAQLTENDLVDKEVLKKLSNDINCREYPSEHIIQGAFTGLFLLKEFDIIEGRTKTKDPCDSWLHINLLSSKENIPLLKFILKHWKKLKEIFGMDIGKKLFNEDEITINVWNKMADYIDEESGAKDDLLACISSQDKPVYETNVLNFLSRFKPKSKFLLDTCLHVLKDSVSKRGVWDSIFTAAYIIGTQFKGDRDILELLLKNFNISELSYPLILTLCFGWPDYSGLENTLEKLKKKDEENPFRVPVYTYLFCTIKPVSEVLTFMDWIFGEIDYVSGWYQERIRIFIKERVLRDNKFRELLEKKLLEQPSAHQKVTYISLLRLVGALNEKVYDWCIEEIEKQRSEYLSPEVGFDFVSGDYKVVMHVLLEAVEF